MRVFDLALKDLSQILRDKMSLVFLVVMPIGFTFFMGLAFQGITEPEDPRLVLGWADADPQGTLSRNLRQSLADSEAVRLVDMDPDQANSALREGEAAGVLIIPEDFSKLALAGDPVQLTLLTEDPGVSGQSLFQILRTPVTETLSAAAIARLSTEFLASEGVLDGETAQAVERSAALETAAEAWSEAQGRAEWIQMEKASGQETAAADTIPLDGNPFNQSSPGMIVQFTIFGLIPAAQILVLERKTRTLQRLITTALRPWQIIAGHMLAMFILILLQVTLLVIFGQAALGVAYLHAPLGTLLVGAALSLWVASMGLLIGVLAKEEEQVIIFSLIAMFLFTSLGGAWFPLEGVGKTFSTIGYLTPGAWAMEGFQNIVIRGLGSTSAWQPAGILLAYALFFFAIGVWRFKAGEER